MRIHDAGRRLAEADQPIYVMSDRELDDYTIHNAIIMELQKRGFRVIDSGEKARPSPGLDEQTGNLIILF